MKRIAMTARRHRDCRRRIGARRARTGRVLRHRGHGARGSRSSPGTCRFSTLKVLDLDFETRLERPVYGEHVLRFKVFTPSGFLYQDLNVPFTWPQAAARPGRQGRRGVQAVPVSSTADCRSRCSAMQAIAGGAVATRSAPGCRSPARRSR